MQSPVPKTIKSGLFQDLLSPRIPSEKHRFRTEATWGLRNLINRGGKESRCDEILCAVAHKLPKRLIRFMLDPE